MDVECPVARAILAALRDSADEYEAHGILVVTDLAPTSGLRTNDEIVYRAVTTIFRALPRRLARGAVLRIATHPRAGGDVELIWEAREDIGMSRNVGSHDPLHVLATGPHGDLLNVAVTALEEICRARGGLVEQDHQEPPLSSGLLREPTLRRRYLFLIPSLERGVRAPLGAD